MNTTYVSQCPYTVSTLLSVTVGISPQYYLVIGGTGPDRPPVVPSCPPLLLPLNGILWSVLLQIFDRLLPIVYSFHKSTILFGPVLYPFFDTKKLSPSISYLPNHEIQMMQVKEVFGNLAYVCSPSALV